MSLVLAAASPGETSFMVTGFPLVASRSRTKRRLNGSGGVLPIVVATSQSQEARFAPFTFTSILYRQPRGDARALSKRTFMPHPTGGSWFMRGFLSLV